MSRLTFAYFKSSAWAKTDVEAEYAIGGNLAKSSMQIVRVVSSERGIGRAIAVAAALHFSFLGPLIAVNTRLLLLRVLLLLVLLGQHRFDAPLLLDQERPDDAVTHALRAT